MRPIQYFSDAYLEQCKGATAEQVLSFLDDFRRIQGQDRPAKSKLISLKVPEPLLADFRRRCDAEGLKYQTQIKVLMDSWLQRVGNP